MSVPIDRVEASAFFCSQVTRSLGPDIDNYAADRNR
jgi:hypothetical protein